MYLGVEVLGPRIAYLLSVSIVKAFLSDIIRAGLMAYVLIGAASF